MGHAHVIVYTLHELLLPPETLQTFNIAIEIWRVLKDQSELVMVDITHCLHFNCALRYGE